MLHLLRGSHFYGTFYVPHVSRESVHQESISGMVRFGITRPLQLLWIVFGSWHYENMVIWQGAFQLVVTTILTVIQFMVFKSHHGLWRRLCVSESNCKSLQNAYRFINGFLHLTTNSQSSTSVISVTNNFFPPTSFSKKSTWKSLKKLVVTQRHY